MSRSVHTTLKKLIVERRFEYSDEDLKDDRINKMYDELNKKRLIKKQILLERKQGETLFQTVQLLDASAMNIEVQDQGEFVHYPASIDDLIEVSRRLPPGTLSGINSIVFCLGKEYQEKYIDEDEDEIRDPYTGRLSCEDNGIVYSSPISGSYFLNTCKIFLYAYVYDKRRLQLEIIEPFLRLQMLSTFIHEAAHHDDNMRRSGQGRWLGLNKWKCEDYAELKQMEWSREVIVPYLLERYPDEYRRLLSWLKQHGGVDFPLEILAGESGGRKIGDMVKLVFSATSAVEELFVNVIEGKSTRENIINFAWGLHFGDYYRECLISLDTLLTNDPNDSEAMGIKADTLIHLERYNEAELTALKCLSIDMYNIDALEALCDVYQHLKNWGALENISQKGIEAVGTLEDKSEHYKIRTFVEANIIAALYLRKFNIARESVELLPTNGRYGQRKNAFTALITLLEGDLKKAIDICKDILKLDKVVAPAKAILKGVYNEAADKLGECDKLLALSEYEKGFLEGSDIMGLLNQGK